MSMAVETETAIPEPDRVPACPHPRETTALFGHERAEGTLLEAHRSGRLHHAWLLTGPQGVGKATLAYRFARFLLANPGAEDAAGAGDLSVPPESPVFRQVASQAHPDLLVLRRPWQAQRKRHAGVITVDETRRLRAFLGQTAAAGAWRVVIVDAADDLNISAVNALLKSLEEPPPACVILLVSAVPGRLPVTVRSRCRRLPVAPLPETAARRAVDQALAAGGAGAPAGEAALSDCLALSQGSPGAALRLLADDGADLYRTLLSLVAQLPRLDHAKVHELADSLAAAGADSRYELFHMLLGDLIRRLVGHAAGAGRALDDEKAIAERLRIERNLARWAGLWETLQQAKAQADALNLDRKALVLDIFFRLERAARGEPD